jgi:hypothetical protein
MKNPKGTGGKVERKPDKRKPDDPEQSRRFEETARDVEAVDDSDAFERALSSIAEARGGPKTSEPP